jgi:SOS response regulatory protein OraA/RecX
VRDRHKAWRLLARRGFDETTVETVLDEWTGDSRAG